MIKNLRFLFVLILFFGCDAAPFKIVEDFKDQKILSSLKELKPGKNIIVTLGYGLNNDGSMKPPLIMRLEKTLEVARTFPQTLVVVSGGVPKNNTTESRQMKKWLIKKGIAPERIFEENKSRDTVGNAKHATKILRAQGVDHVILISSSSHLSRASLLFRIALNKGGMEKATLQPLAPDAIKSDNGHSWSLYRDAFRMFLLVGRPLT